MGVGGWGGSQLQRQQIIVMFFLITVIVLTKEEKGWTYFCVTMRVFSTRLIILQFFSFLFKMRCICAKTEPYACWISLYNCYFNLAPTKLINFVLSVQFFIVYARRKLTTCLLIYSRFVLMHLPGKITYKERGSSETGFHTRGQSPNL